MTHTQTQGADGAGAMTAGAEWPDSSPNPTPEELASPQFEAVWQAIKSWDIGIPEEYGGYCGATGSHVVRILRALSAPTPAPAATPSVPDSVRDILKEARDGLAAYTGGSDGACGDTIARIDALIAAQPAATPYGWAYTWTDDDCDGGAVEQKFSRTEPDAANPYISGILPLFAAQPAATPGVPDSVRALSEAASPDWDTNDATPYILGPQIDGEYDRFEVIARGPHGHAKSGDAIRKWQANRMFAVAAVNYVRALIAARPGGQSEDETERCIACDRPLRAGERVLPDAEGGTIHTACCGPERESYTGADGGPLGPNDPIPQGYVYEPDHPAGQSAGSGAETVAATLAEFQRQNGYHKREIEELLTEFGELLLSKVVPAPNSTRTGAAETEARDVSGARSLLERVWDHTGIEPQLHRDIAAWLSDDRCAQVDAILAARPEAPSDAGWRERVRHVKRGTEYEVLGEAEAQVSKGESNRFGEWRALYERDKLTVYRGSDGKLWCRFTDEMRDGRFETITPPSDPAPSGQADTFPKPRRKDGEPPCGECHLHAGETCDICGAVAPPAPSGQTEG